MNEKTDKFLMKDVFTLMDQWGHEQVIFCRHPGSGLKAIIAIHNSILGPALGGCRMMPYDTTEDALEDVLQLSRGMTYKCAIADVDFGGGKMVVIGDPKLDKSPEKFRAVGRFVESLHGRFYTGTDMGTNPEDFVHASRESKFFVGLPEVYGGSGDTSIPTAIGVLQGIRATSQYLYGTDSLLDKVIAIQGVGKVGGRLAQLLLDEGARLIIADVNPDACYSIQQLAPDFVTVTSIDDILSVACDFLAPCAQGGVIDLKLIQQLKCRAIVGSANNQLADDSLADLLMKQEILYAPDYLVNAGGLIQVAVEIQGQTRECVEAKTHSIYEMLLQVYQRAEEYRISTCQAANEIVKERLEKIADLRRIYLGL